jgi:hypothetical protein
MLVFICKVCIEKNRLYVPRPHNNRHLTSKSVLRCDFLTVDIRRRSRAVVHSAGLL